MKPQRKKKKSASPSFGLTLPERFRGASKSAITGSLIVLEGVDGSGRSTQIELLKEWLESEGYAVRTMGLRRSALVAKNLDDVLAKNVVTRVTLSLLYATDFFHQLESVIMPALQAGFVVLADRYIFTLIARGAVRGIKHPYLHSLYQLALRPHLTFWLDISPQAAFERGLKKDQGISYWESGRDMHLSNDLYKSFIRYQTMIRKEFDYFSKRYGFIHLNGEAQIPVINRVLRKYIAAHLGLDSIRYKPSQALMHLWA